MCLSTKRDIKARVQFRKGGFIDEIFIGTGYRDFGDENGFIR